MVKASVIRIGNWLWHHSPNGEIERIQVKSIHPEYGINMSSEVDHVWEIPYEELHPVEITEGILLSAGFKTQDMTDMGTLIYLDLSDEITLSWNKSTIWIGEHDCNCKYLHELQNLHLALSCQELVIPF